MPLGLGRFPDWRGCSNVEAYRLDRYDNSIEMPLWLTPLPRLARMLKCRSFVWVEVSTNKALPRWGSWVKVGGKQKAPHRLMAMRGIGGIIYVLRGGCGCFCANSDSGAYCFSLIGLE
jgi:hypothetical protein